MRGPCVEYDSYDATHRFVLLVLFFAICRCMPDSCNCLFLFGTTYICNYECVTAVAHDAADRTCVFSRAF